MSRNITIACRLFRVTIVGFIAFFTLRIVDGQLIPVPNSSFESPRTDFAFPQIDSWQRTPKPDWFQETAEQQWAFLIGVFKNTPPGASDHIGNLEGDQALFLFAQPEVGIFQDYDSIGGTNTAPSHEFDAIYEPGKRYDLSVDLFGGGGNMKEGVALKLSLYYRDAASNIVTIASRTITNTATLFPNQTNFITFSISSPAVTPNSEFVGKHIGIAINSIVDFTDAGGYWDIDNIRLIATDVPSSTIPVPNSSFESPETDFALPQINSWQRSPKPAWFPETPDQQWIFLTGVFQNTASGSPDHIGNLDGEQALFLFAQPEVALFQDYNTIGGTNSAPTHEFDAVYEPNRTYTLSLGLLGGGGNMKEGVPFQFSLYYRDDASNMVSVASRTITNSATLFPSITNLVSFSVATPIIASNSPAAGKHIGIMLASAVGFEDAGGYWDLDNVTLSADGAFSGRYVSILRDDEDTLKIQWAAHQGMSYQIQSSDDLVSWSNVGDPEPATEPMNFRLLPRENVSARFYRVQEIPTP